MLKLSIRATSTALTPGIHNESKYITLLLFKVSYVMSAPLKLFWVMTSVVIEDEYIIPSIEPKIDKRFFVDFLQVAKVKLFCRAGRTI